jgi:hypothetical protein
MTPMTWITYIQIFALLITLDGRFRPFIMKYRKTTHPSPKNIHTDISINERKIMKFRTEVRIIRKPHQTQFLVISNYT